MMRVSTLTSPAPPSRENSPSWSTWRSFAWRLGCISLISSRKIVPPLAYSNLPSLRFWAPVKAPFSKPKSSLSSSSEGSAAQLTFTKGLSRRLDIWKSERATSSLPVPLAPRISTVMSVSDTCSRMSRTSRILGVSPASSSISLSVRARLRSCSTSILRARFSRAFWKAISSSSASKGLRRKSLAPSRMASTMVRACPWPESMITGTWDARFLSSRRVSRPSMPGSTTSRVIRSGFASSRMRRASSPPATADTSYPCRVTRASMYSRSPGSSSITITRNRSAIVPPSLLVHPGPAPGGTARPERDARRSGAARNTSANHGVPPVGDCFAPPRGDLSTQNGSFRSLGGTTVPIVRTSLPWG